MATRDAALERVPRKATESANTYARRLFTEASTRVVESDADKDKVLIDAFSAAISAALDKATR